MDVDLKQKRVDSKSERDTFFYPVTLATDRFGNGEEQKYKKYLDVCITPLQITEMKFKLRTGHVGRHSAQHLSSQFLTASDGGSCRNQVGTQDRT